MYSTVQNIRHQYIVHECSVVCVRKVPDWATAARKYDFVTAITGITVALIQLGMRLVLVVYLHCAMAQKLHFVALLHHLLPSPTKMLRQWLLPYLLLQREVHGIQ